MNHKQQNWSDKSDRRLAADSGEAHRAAVAHKRLFVVLDPSRLPEAHSRPSPVLVDELDAGQLDREL